MQNVCTKVSLQIRTVKLCCYFISASCIEHEVRAELRRIQSEKLHNLYSSPNIIRAIKSSRMRWFGQVARMGDGYIPGSGGATWRKRAAWRPRRRWEENIRINVQEIWQEVWVGLNWFWTEKICLRVPLNTGNFFTSWETVRFSRRTLFHAASTLATQLYYAANLAAFQGVLSTSQYMYIGTGDATIEYSKITPHWRHKTVPWCTSKEHSSRGNISVRKRESDFKVYIFSRFM
jgi:hypothetical protein